MIDAIGCTLFESAKYGGFKITRGGCSPTLRANKVCTGVIILDVKYKGVEGGQEHTSTSARQSQAEIIKTL